ncbi:integral membrane protein [Colletotrichum tabaci]|uniref:Integral membrane protein n=1 Tax=Colletotrichum tabaci TaxID=1209068 RepID=A0AAV9SVK5_9PEZI
MSEVSVIPAPPGVEVNFDHPRQQKVLEHYLIFGIGGTLAFIAICQRFYTKLFLSKGLQIDDAFMFLGWAASIVTQGMLVASIIEGGMCAHAWEMPLSRFERYSVTTFVTAPVFMLCNGFTKLSLLTFYLHISPQKWFRVAVWTVIVVVSLYTGCIAILMLFHCSPIRKAFDFHVTGGTCLNVGVLYMATAVSNIVTDVMLFVLPIPMIFNLRMKLAQKISAVLIFAIGSVTVATSIVRLTYLPRLLSSLDPSWDAAPANLWTFIEANLFVLCGSMPTLRKFFKHFAPRFMRYPTNPSSYTHNNYRASGSTMQRSNIPKNRQRKQSEQFPDENALKTFNSDRTREEDVGFTSVVVATGERASVDDTSNKAILQTKTITIQRD